MSAGSYVYAIEGAGLVKIGISVSPQYRMKGFQAGSPVELRLAGAIEGSHALEKEIHERFDRYRAHGEWFRFEGEVKDWVSSLESV